ncbi:hypothetical protein ColTof4_13438 [Colletotrichum tofieldiae]|nr:hypothetical protein ColTof4_13438 [Colletotrichum tofieldiae]GKT88453.1 hypothetical protein Ct61P_06303 [Colletotrichum tofieldiae]
MVAHVALEGMLRVLHLQIQVGAHGADLALEAVDAALEVVNLLKLAQLLTQRVEDLRRLGVAVLGLLAVLVDRAEDGADLVIDRLQAVVQVGKLRSRRCDGVGVGVGDGVQVNRAAVNLDLEDTVGLAQLDLAGATEVAVVILAVAEGEGADVALGLVVGRAVVQEAAHHAAGAAVAVDDKDEAVEAGRRVGGAHADVGRATVGEPDVEVPARALGAVGSEVDVGDEVAVHHLLGAPDGTALVPGRDRGEDDFVGKDLGLVRLALEDKVGDVAVIVG